MVKEVDLRIKIVIILSLIMFMFLTNSLFGEDSYSLITSRNTLEWQSHTPSTLGNEADQSVSLFILNEHSHPRLGGNWTVYFETEGISDLVIEPVYGTYWEKDINFLELRCGNRVVDASVVDGKVVVEDYLCDRTSAEFSQVVST